MIVLHHRFFVKVPAPAPRLPAAEFLLLTRFGYCVYQSELSSKEL